MIRKNLHLGFLDRAVTNAESIRGEQSHATDWDELVPSGRSSWYPALSLFLLVTFGFLLMLDHILGRPSISWKRTQVYL
jgi:hypothetical protein